MLIIGQLEDQLGLIVWGNISHQLFSISMGDIAGIPLYRYLFGGMLEPWNTNQPLIWTLLSAGLSLFGVGFYNLFIIINILVNFVAAFILFRKYRYGVYASVLFTFSSYFWIHLGRHVVEQQIWVFPVFFRLLLDSHEKPGRRNALKVGLFVVFTTLISNYYGYFLILLLSMYTLATVLWKAVYLREQVRSVIKYYILSVCAVVAGLLVFLFPYINANYFNKSYDNVSDRFDMKLQRPYEDFFTFSSRPWYFILPPVDNPIYGNLSGNVISRIKQGGYFLSDDYFKGEHSGNYVGITFLLVSIVMGALAFKYSDKRNRHETLILTFSLLLLLSTMMPPFFTVSGFTVYTPGWLLYKLFPMFRTTARMSVLIQMILLWLFLKNISILERIYTNKKGLLSLLVIIVTIFTLVESYIPVKVTRIDKVPAAYSYLKNNTQPGTKFVVYPYKTVNDGLYWLHAHQRELINPRYMKGNFNSETFTKNIPTVLGTEELILNDIDYLLLYKRIRPEDDEFIDNSGYYKRLVEEDDLVLYKVVQNSIIEGYGMNP